MTAVLPFLTRRPQTKKELADRMGITPRAVEESIMKAEHDARMEPSGTLWGDVA